ncbi:MAG TPA: hypothetical protein VGS16_06555 [Candidatus Dormibacteraeota bacterium]|nr:hypothetical protein [Candidatus Dormibacteraeota bacterium]
MISTPSNPPPSTAEPQRGSGPSSGLRRTIIAVVIIAIVVIGIVGYALAGFTYTAGRVANADKSLNTVVSHQNSLNTTFKDIGTKVSGLNSSSNSDLAQTHALYAQFVANAKSTGTTVDRDDASLVSAKASLTEQQWLAVFTRSSLDKEAARVDHARRGLAIAKTLAGDYVQVYGFFEAFSDSEIDLEKFSTQVATADFTSAKATLATMKTHVDNAQQLSTAPGLPSQLHDVAIDLGTLVTDFGKLVDAGLRNNDPAILSANNSVAADANKLAAYNYDKILTDIGAYYQPLIAAFNSEMTQATA